MNNSKLSIDISKREQISGTSEGKVTGVTWDPVDGLSRQEAIVKARQEAYEQQVEELKNSTPEEMRLRTIELRIERVEAHLNHLEKTAKAKAQLLDG